MRKAGGGRKKITDTDPSLMENLDAFIEPVTRVEPCSPLRWTSKSTSKLARALKELGSKTIVRTVAKLFHKLGYSLQSNQKTKEELSHRDRESQFQYINEKVKDFQHRNQPVVSVDTKKRELIGNYKNKNNNIATSVFIFMLSLNYSSIKTSKTLMAVSLIFVSGPKQK